MFLVRDKLLYKLRSIEQIKNFIESDFYYRRIKTTELERNMWKALTKSLAIFIYYLIYKNGIIHNYKYIIIIFLMITINIFYNMTLSFYKKREIQELKNYLELNKIGKQDYIFELILEEDLIKRASGIRKYFLYCMTRNYYMFPLSFISYYNSIYFFLLENNFFPNSFWIKEKVNNNIIIFYNIYWKLMNFIFLNCTFIIVFSFFFSLFYKFSLENKESINKTPFI